MQPAPSVTPPAAAVQLTGNQFAPQVVRTPVHHFRVPGSTLKFTLRKRREGRFEPWYLVSIIKGKRFHHSTQAPDVKTAEEVAKVKYVLPALKQDWEKVNGNKLKRHWATVGELLAHWCGLNLGAAEAHKRQAANQLRNVLRQAGQTDPDAVSCGELNGRMAYAYFNAVEREAAECGSQIAAARRKRTGLSTWNQAKSVLQKNALVAYEDADLELPDMDEFLERGAMRVKRMKKDAKLEEAPPDLDLMAKLIEQWPALPWNEFAAVGLALGFGLRAGEWGKARWEWFKARDGRVWIDTETDVKNKTGRLKVKGLNPFWATFAARAQREGKRAAEGFIIEGTDGERKERVEVRVSEWMRAKGWKGQKTNHSFRAYAGALVVLRWGHAEARDWLRHASVETTQKHYTDRWRDENLGRAVVVEWAAE